MAISLLVNPVGSPPEDAREVPVATLAIFDRLWAPAIQALNLQWIPLFRPGFPLAQEDVGSVIAELRALRAALNNAGGEAAEIILPRIDGLLAELQSASPESDLYIG